MSSTSNFPGGFSGGVTIQNVPINIPHPGKVFWVNNSSVLSEGGISGSNSNPGTFRQPFGTLDYAVGKCKANRGDVIYIMPGYTQDMAAADAVDVDVAGVRIIGLGSGALRPKFTYSNAAGEFVIGADQVRIENLWFVPSVTGVTHAIDVETGNQDFQMVNCEFSGREAAGDEFNAAITVTASCPNGLIQGCYFDSSTDQAIYGISLNTPTNWWILDNTIVGDYSTACIGTITGAGVGCRMFRNVIVNGHPGDLAANVEVFTQSAAGTWLLGENIFATNITTDLSLMFTNFTSTVNLGNLYTDDTTMALTAHHLSAVLAVSADA